MEGGRERLVTLCGETGRVLARVAEPQRDDRGEPAQRLGERDRRDGQDQPGAVPEVTREEADERTERDRSDDARGDGEHVADAVGDVQLDREDRGDDPELRLGEVDDAVGPIHEDDADRDQGVEGPVDDPEEDDAGRQPLRQHVGEHRPQRDGADDPGECPGEGLEQRPHPGAEHLVARVRLRVRGHDRTARRRERAWPRPRSEPVAGSRGWRDPPAVRVWGSDGGSGRRGGAAAVTSVSFRRSGRTSAAPRGTRRSQPGTPGRRLP